MWIWHIYKPIQNNEKYIYFQLQTWIMRNLISKVFFIIIRLFKIHESSMKCEVIAINILFWHAFHISAIMAILLQFLSNNLIVFSFWVLYSLSISLFIFFQGTTLNSGRRAWKKSPKSNMVNYRYRILMHYYHIS